MALSRTLAAGALCVALAACANVALSQATRPAAAAPPAAVDAYKNVPLPSARGGATTQATATGAKTAQSDPLDTKRVAFALGVVLVSIYVGHRVWRRLGMPGSGSKSGQSLQVVSRLAVSPKQQVLLIRVGRRFVLVGNSGTQMNPLCEISDPDEAAALLGQTVSESRESSSATFHDVLDGAQGRFDEEIKAKKDEDDQESALAATRDELNSMMDKVRSLSKQFQHGRA